MQRFVSTKPVARYKYCCTSSMVNSFDHVGIASYPNQAIPEQAPKGRLPVTKCTFLLPQTDKILILEQEEWPRNIFPRHEKTRFLPMRKQKEQTSFAVTVKLISYFVFAIRIVQSLFLLNSKFQASSPFLLLHRPICVVPGRKTKGADQLRSNREADQLLCFRYSDSTIPLFVKFEISSF